MQHGISMLRFLNFDLHNERYGLQTKEHFERMMNYNRVGLNCSQLNLSEKHTGHSARRSIDEIFPL